MWNKTFCGMNYLMIRLDQRENFTLYGRFYCRYSKSRIKCITKMCKSQPIKYTYLYVFINTLKFRIAHCIDETKIYDLLLVTCLWSLL